MQPLDKFLDRLDKVRQSGKGYIACCPAHKDKSPSMNITEADDGKVLIHCFAGCRPSEICGALGLDEQDMFPPKPEPICPPGATRPEPKLYFSRKQLDELDMQVWFVAVAKADLSARKRISEHDKQDLARCLKSLREARWGLFSANHLDLFIRVDYVLETFTARRSEVSR